MAEEIQRCSKVHQGKQRENLKPTEEIEDESLSAQMLANILTEDVVVVKPIIINSPGGGAREEYNIGQQEGKSTHL